jgi:hypothetical protein
LIRGLRIVHAGIGQCADVREPARLEIIEVKRAIRSRIHTPSTGSGQRLRAQMDACAELVEASVNVRVSLTTMAIR